MRRFPIFKHVVLFYSLFLLTEIPMKAQSMLGFSSESGQTQRMLEKRFDANLIPDSLQERLKILSARPHHVGSPYDKQNAEYIEDRFKSWGYDTKIVTYYVLFPTPKFRLLEMTAPQRYKAKLQEPVLKEDRTSNQTKEQLPTYNAYSKDGDVEAEVVYVNYGVPKDYEELERRGIDVKGKIVIAKYFGSWRGIKPKVAAEHGAIGCLIYTDPKDDGYYQGDVYPKGPFKRADGVQRGSVMDMPLYPGDPLTPGYAATKNAKRLKVADAPTLTKIPVLPISAEDALPILRSLVGPVAPASWRGALPITYHMGPGKSKVHLKLEFNWDIKPAYDVIARMPGSEYPDQWIMRGNHQDAWVNGAHDPLSGLIAEMEEARSLGLLVKNGFRPKRTIIYAAWDAEEPGLIGSTEWVEDHQDELKKKLVAYINTDGNGRGFLGVGGSHALEKLVNEVAASVPDPQSNLSVLQRLKDRLLVVGNDKVKNEVRSRADLRISPLGSGSDYSPFLQHLGISSLNVGYGGESSGGSYHSIFDSYDYFLRFVDPGMEYGVTLAKTTGRLTLRLANADWLPFDYQGLADNVNKYVNEVVELADKMRVSTVEVNKLIANGAYKASLDPKKELEPPKPKDEVPYLDFSPLLNANEKLQESSVTFGILLPNMSRLNSADKHKFDQLAGQSERFLTTEQGLPRRPWYKHSIYAPGFYTGYGVKTLPGVREAIEQRNWSEANEQIRLTAASIEHFVEHLDQINKLLKGEN